MNNQIIIETFFVSSFLYASDYREIFLASAKPTPKRSGRERKRGLTPYPDEDNTTMLFIKPICVIDSIHKTIKTTTTKFLSESDYAFRSELV